MSSGSSKFARCSGCGYACVLTTAGGVKCWGDNTYYQLGQPLSFHTVQRGLTAQGVVRTDGNPLAGAVLRITGMGAAYAHKESISDSSGIFTLPVVEGVPYNLTPELAGYTFAPPSITGTMLADINQDFVATLITYNITGTVTANSNPLSDVTVDGGILGTRSTDTSGNYAFNTITPGTVYTLTVTHSGATFGVDTASGTLNSHATHDFSGTLTTHTLSGAITVGGNPLAGVTVSGGGLGSTTTDAGGAYSFTGVDYGTSYTITPSLADYDFTPTSSSGTVTADVTRDFNAVYNPPTTTSTSSIASTTVGTTTTELATSSTVEATTTAASSSVPVTSTVVGTSTLATTSIAPTTSSVQTSTTSVASSTTIGTTSAPTDSDGDGLTDAEEETHNTDPADADSDDDGVTDSEEVTTGTNPKDPGSLAPKLRTTICSDWNGYLGGSTGRGMYNIMEHINLTTKKLRVKTELRNIRGHLKDTYEFFLRGNQQFDLLVHDMNGREVNSYGQVCTTYTRSPAGSLDGRMVYYKYDDNGSIQFAFALPFENPSVGTSALSYNTMQPSLDPQDSGNLVANWVQLSNVSKKRLKGKLYFHRLDGSQLAMPVDVNLRDGARYDYSAHAYGANLAGLIRFVPTDKTVEYQLRAIRYLYDNPSGLDSFTSAYPFNAAAGSGETLFAPVDTSVTSDNSTSAILELSNTLNKKVSVTINLYDKTGKVRLYSKTQSLKAYSSLHLPLDNLLANATGLLTARSSHTGSIIGSVVHYGRTISGSVRSMFVAPLREPVGTTIKSSYNTYLNQGCTLYLGNAATAKEAVTVALKQNDGTVPVKNYSLTVPARGLLSLDICASSPKNVYGVVTVTATKAKRISGLIVRTGEGERYKIATPLR